jgi:hypothetical protein
MTTRTAESSLPLKGVPDGLLAYPVYSFRADGDGRDVPVKTRRGLHKVRIVHLANRSVSAGSPPYDPFLVQATERRWPSIAARYGSRAHEQAIEYARLGLVELRYSVDDLLRLGQPLGWALTAACRQWREQRRALREQETGRLVDAATHLAAMLEVVAPAVAAALRSTTAAKDSVRLQVLIFAGRDLLDGVVHDGPRAFSQAHYGDTKIRDDAEAFLLAAGVPDEYVLALGLQRQSRFGVAGITAAVGDATVELDRLGGLVLVPANASVRYRRALTGSPLVVVENLQAAEALAIRYSDAAIIYSAGVPGPDALRHIAEIGADAPQSIIVPDADLGGVVIATALLTALPTADVVDIGSYPHRPRSPFADGGRALTELRERLAEPATTLADAVLERGYPVEQELSTVAAVTDWLARPVVSHTRR